MRVQGKTTNLGCVVGAMVCFWLFTGLGLWLTGKLAEAVRTPSVDLFAIVSLGVPVAILVSVRAAGAIGRRVNARILEQVKRPASAATVVTRKPGETPPPCPFAVDVFGHGRRPEMSATAAARVEHAHAATAAIEAEFTRRLTWLGLVLLIGIVIGAGLGLVIGDALPGGATLLWLSVIPIILIARAWASDRSMRRQPAGLLAALHLIGVVALLVLLVSDVSAFARGGSAFAAPPMVLLLTLAVYVYGWYAWRRVSRARAEELTAAPVQLVLLWVFGAVRHYASLRDSLWPVWRFTGPGASLNGPGDLGRSPTLRGRLELLRGRPTDLVLDTPERVRARVHELRTTGAGVPTIWGQGPWSLGELRCSDGVWQLAVDQLLVDADVVLMNLSGFSPANAGCTWELGELIDRVPTRCFVLMVDGATDLDFLYGYLRGRWAGMADTSPNRDPRTAPIQVYVSPLEAELPEKEAYRWEMVGDGENARMARRPTPALEAWQRRETAGTKNVGEDILALLCAGAASVTAARQGLAPGVQIAAEASTEQPTSGALVSPALVAQAVSRTALGAASSAAASDAPRRSGTLVTSLTSRECMELLQAQLTPSGPKGEATARVTGAVNPAQFRLTRYPSTGPSPELIGQFASDGEHTHIFVEIRDGQGPSVSPPSARPSRRLVHRVKLALWLVVFLACAGVLAWLRLVGISPYGFSLVATVAIGGLLVAMVLSRVVDGVFSLPIRWGWPPAFAFAEPVAPDAGEPAWLWQFVCETLSAEVESGT